MVVRRGMGATISADWGTNADTLVATAAAADVGETRLASIKVVALELSLEMLVPFTSAGIGRPV